MSQDKVVGLHAAAWTEVVGQLQKAAEDVHEHGARGVVGAVITEEGSVVTFFVGPALELLGALEATKAKLIGQWQPWGDDE